MPTLILRRASSADMLVVSVAVDSDIDRGFGVVIDVGVIDVGSIIAPGRFPEFRFCERELKHS